MPTKKRPILTISVSTGSAPSKYLITATFKDAPPISIDTSNPKQALMQVALQAAIYLIMRQQGLKTMQHPGIPAELRKALTLLDK